MRQKKRQRTATARETASVYSVKEQGSSIVQRVRKISGRVKEEVCCQDSLIQGSMRRGRGFICHLSSVHFDLCALFMVQTWPLGHVSTILDSQDRGRSPARHRTANQCCRALFLLDITDRATATSMVPILPVRCYHGASRCFSCLQSRPSKRLCRNLQVQRMMSMKE